MKTLLAIFAVVLTLGGSASAASNTVGKLIATQAHIAELYANDHCNLTEFQKGAVFQMMLETYRRFGLIAPIGAAPSEQEDQFERAAITASPMLAAIDRGDPQAIDVFCRSMRFNPVFP